MKNQITLRRLGVLAAGLTASALSFADASSATAAITAAQADGLSIAGGLLAMAVAIWGAMFIKRKFFG